MAQVTTNSVSRGMESNPEPIKSPIRYQRLTTATTLMCGHRRKAVKMGTAHSRHLKGINRV